MKLRPPFYKHVPTGDIVYIINTAWGMVVNGAYVPDENITDEGEFVQAPGFQSQSNTEKSVDDLRCVVSGPDCGGEALVDYVTVHVETLSILTAYARTTLTNNFIAMPEVSAAIKTALEVLDIRVRALMKRNGQ